MAENRNFQTETKHESFHPKNEQTTSLKTSICQGQNSFTVAHRALSQKRHILIVCDTLSPKVIEITISDRV